MATTATETSTAAVDPVCAANTAATVDIGAILDYASSFGTLVISRAYADWSLRANSRLR